MTSPYDRDENDNEPIDRLAVQRDAALVHALATRTLPPPDVDIDEPVVTYLASWVDWVDAAASDRRPSR